jgi:hypothetical protein
MFWGLLACTIPIIIHLIFRRRYQRLPWAAMKFLLAAYRKTKTTLLVENLLLLLLRILLIVVLVTLFARPIARLLPGVMPGRQTEHFVLVLDNSFSMEVREANISPLEKAKRLARSIIEKAKENDTITLLTLNEHPQMLLTFKSLTSQESKNEVLQKLERITISDMGTDVEATIFLLREELRQNKNVSNKHVYLFSDFQRKPWEKALKSKTMLDTVKEIREQVISFELVDVGVNETANLGITSLENDGVAGIGILTRFVASVRNFGSKPFDNAVLNFYVDGSKKNAERLSLRGQEQIEVPFFDSFEQAGNHHVSVELNSDQVTPDNKRHLSFVVVNKVRVLLIDGEPKEGIFARETDYLMAAFGRLPDSLILAERVDISGLSSQLRFRDYDVVVLANLQTFDSENRFKELEEFVAKGGGLFIWLGEKVPMQYYNQELFKDGLGLLPASIVGSPFGNASDSDEKTTFNWQGFAKHPVWRYFYLNQRLMEDAKKCLFYRFTPVKVDSDDNTVRVLARYNDVSQYPAVVERRFGRGKVILATTTADREWNSMHSDQFGHVFLIMAHEFVQYLVARPAEENNIYVGQPFIRKFDALIQNAQITIAGGDSKIVGIQGATSVATDKQKLGLGTNESRIEYRDVFKAGVYTLEYRLPSVTLEDPKGKEVRDYFAVNVQPEEGDLARLSREELLDKVKTLGVQYRKDAEETRQESKVSQQSEYWKPLLLLLLILVNMETFLAMWFGRFKR